MTPTPPIPGQAHLYLDPESLLCDVVGLCLSNERKLRNHGLATLRDVLASPDDTLALDISISFVGMDWVRDARRSLSIEPWTESR